MSVALRAGHHFIDKASVRFFTIAQIATMKDKKSNGLFMEAP